MLSFSTLPSESMMSVAIQRSSALGMGEDELGFEIGSSEELLDRGSRVLINPLVALSRIYT